MADSPASRSEKWKANERELERLADLPVGDVDPAAREAALEKDQDELEYEAGEEYLRRSREERAG